MSKKAKPKGCNCVNEVNEQLKPMNARIPRGLQIDIAAATAGMSPPRVLVERIKPLRDGKSTPAIYCTFCPFCGKRYPE